jgi:hypothetical protein
VTDTDRIPAHLRAEADELLPFARAVHEAVLELTDRLRRLRQDWTSDRYPSLATEDDLESLDLDLVEACGLREVDVLLSAMALRAEHAVEGEQHPETFERYGLSGPGIDDYEPEVVAFCRMLNEAVDDLEREGSIIRVDTVRQQGPLGRISRIVFGEGDE